MSVLDELTSEDVGFKLNSSDQGAELFDTGVDLEKYAESKLNLLAIANSSQIIAASNGHQVAIGNLNDIENLSKIDIQGATEIFFNHDESKLLLNVNGSVSSLDVSKYLSSKDTTLSPIEDNATSILPCPASDDLLILKDTVLTVRNSSISIDNVVAFTWSQTDYFYITSDDQTTIKGSDGSKVSIELEEIEGLAPISLLPVAENKFMVVFESSESSLDYHDTKSFIIDNGLTILADLAAPFGSTPRCATYYLSKLSNWIKNQSFNFITSSVSTEVNTLLLNPLQSVLQSEDTNRAQFPIDDDTGDDVSPVGIALDLTQTSTTVKQPVQGVEEAVGKLPLLYILLHTGKLISWWVFDKKELIDDTVDLSRALKANLSVSREPNQAEINKETVLEGSEKPPHENPFGTSDPFNKTSKPASEKDESKGVLGSLSTNKTEGSSPFGSLNLGKPTESPFGKSTESPFGSLGLGKAKEESPFANLQKPKEESPFANLQKTKEESPFGSVAFGKPKEESSFGSGGFASSGFSKPKESSGFGSSGFGSSGFGSCGFGSSAGSSGFGSSGFGNSGFGSSGFGKSGFGSSGFGKLATDANNSNNSSMATSGFAKFSSSSSGGGFGALGKTDSTKELFSIFNQDKPSSPFDKLKDSKSGDNNESTLIFGSTQKTDTQAKDSTTKPSPFDSLKNFKTEQTESQKIGSKQSPFASLGKLNDALSTPTQDNEVKEKVPSLFNQPNTSSTSEKPLETSEQNEEKKSLFSQSNQLPIGGLTLDASKPTTTNQDFMKNEPESRESKIENVESSFTESQVDSDADSQASSEVSYEDTTTRPDSEEESSDEEVSIGDSHVGTAIEGADKIKEKGQINDVAEDKNEDLFRGRAPVEREELIAYDGLTSETKKYDNELMQQIYTIVSETTAQTEVFKKNVESLGKLVTYHDGPTVPLTTESLEHSDKFILSDNIVDIAREKQPTVTKFLDAAKSVDEDLAALVERIEENQSDRILIDRLLTQLKNITSETTINDLNTRSLDLPNSMLRTKLRSKLKNVQKLEDELQTKLIPLKMKKKKTVEMIANLETVILQLHGDIRHHLDTVDDLSKKVKQLSLNKHDTVPEEIASINLYLRWQLATELSKSTVVPTKVTFSNE